MAVTLTVDELGFALRVDPDKMLAASTHRAELVRRLAAASETATRHAPDAPDELHNEAVVRMVGWLAGMRLDVPEGNALRDSGARALLAPYRAKSGKVVE